jgi:hypothetical protein
MFNIDFDNLIQFLMPTNWRKPKFFSWLKLILSHLNRLYSEFLAFRTQKLYDINFTGQVMYLEKLLNDTFSVTGIYIASIEYHPKIYLHNKGEDFAPVYMGNLWQSSYIHNEGDWVIYNNYWYEYTGAGNGTNPASDPNATQRDKIETFIGNNDEDVYNYDFVVRVPFAVYSNFSDDDILKLKKTIEYYKLAEMRYNINTY